MVITGNAACVCINTKLSTVIAETYTLVTSALNLNDRYVY